MKKDYLKSAKICSEYNYVLEYSYFINAVKPIYDIFKRNLKQGGDVLITLYLLNDNTNNVEFFEIKNTGKYTSDEILKIIVLSEIFKFSLQKIKAELN